MTPAPPRAGQAGHAHAPTWAAAALLLGLGACAGREGTISIGLVTAPGSTVMDDVTHARLILTTPFRTVEADRGPDGSFDLSIDVVANGPSGDVLFEGMNADGDIVAYGRTPPLPIAAIDADIQIYVAAPQSIAEAPVTLGSARTEMGAGVLDYGVLFAGGRDATGAPTDDLEIYNVYDHSLQVGLPLPEPRANPTVATGILGYAYLFGGEDADGNPRGTFWRFDTTATPNGSWFVGTDQPDLARTGAALAPLGSETYLVTGAPPVLMEGIFGRVTPFDMPATLDGRAASVQTPDGQVFGLVVGEGAGATGIVRIAAGDITDESGAPASAIRHGHALAATPLDEILAIGGATATDAALGTVIRCDPVHRSYDELPLLATPRTDAAAAATDAFVVVAGGLDASGAVVPDVELFDPATLEPLGTLPMLVPRSGALALPLPNHQVLIAGGRDAAGEPVDTLELFTPAVPSLD